MKVSNRVRNPGGASFAVLISMLMVALGAWGVEHVVHEHIEWSMLLSPQHIFSLMGAIGSVLGAWLSQSPLK